MRAGYARAERTATTLTALTQSRRFQVILKANQINSTTKLPPIHPGEILDEDFLQPMGITKYALAKAIGVDATRIHSIVLGTRSITAETALLFSRYFGNSVEFWMGLQAQYDRERAEDKG